MSNPIVTVESFACSHILFIFHFISEPLVRKNHMKICAFPQCVLLCIGESMVLREDKKYADECNQTILIPALGVKPRPSPKHWKCYGL